MKRSAILFCILWVLVGCGEQPGSGPELTSPRPGITPSATQGAPFAEPMELKVLYAGSLILPFEQVEAAFEARYPQVDVHMEGHGSIQVVRHITELGDPVDVAVVADHSLIPAMMYSNTIPGTDTPFAEWTVEFATNRVVLAYRPDSQYAGDITPDNWYQILARDDVRKAISDPRFDAAGYRALMVMQLAETYYDQITIFENLLMGRFKTAITTEAVGDQVVIHVPELVEPKPDSGILTRSYSVQLIALLEAGEVDYVFAYDTVARQHQLEYVSLPAAVNLGDEAYSDIYNQVRVNMDFQRFATVPPQFVGQVIGYGITIPNNAPHPETADIFLAWLLGPEGRAVMEESGHPVFEKARVDRAEALPASLRELAVSR